MEPDYCHPQLVYQQQAATPAGQPAGVLGRRHSPERVPGILYPLLPSPHHTTSSQSESLKNTMLVTKKTLFVAILYMSKVIARYSDRY